MSLSLKWFNNSHAQATLHCRQNLVLLKAPLIDSSISSASWWDTVQKSSRIDQWLCSRRVSICKQLLVNPQDARFGSCPVTGDEKSLFVILIKKKSVASFWPGFRICGETGALWSALSWYVFGRISKGLLHFELISDGHAVDMLKNCSEYMIL